MPELYEEFSVKNNQYYVKIEQSGSSIECFIVDCEGNEILGGGLFSIDAEGNLVLNICDSSAAKKANIKLTEDKTINLSENTARTFYKEVKEKIFK